jgi:ABC-type glycerol-3-phosphate transport system substrate-binding protein
VAGLRSSKGENYYIGGYQITWAVPKNAPHKEEAVKFLLAMNSIDIADKWVQYTKSSTGILGRMNDVEFGYDNVENFTYTIQKKYGRSKVSADLPSKLFGTAHASENSYFHEVLQGKMTADEAIKSIKSNLK